MPATARTKLEEPDTFKIDAKPNTKSKNKNKPVLASPFELAPKPNKNQDE